MHINKGREPVVEIEFEGTRKVEHIVFASEGDRQRFVACLVRSQVADDS
jgi:hypothetical protein